MYTFFQIFFKASITGKSSNYSRFLYADVQYFQPEYHRNQVASNFPLYVFCTYNGYSVFYLCVYTNFQVYIIVTVFSLKLFRPLVTLVIFFVCHFVLIQYRKYIQSIKKKLVISNIESVSICHPPIQSTGETARQHVSVPHKQRGNHGGDWRLGARQRCVYLTDWHQVSEFVSKQVFHQEGEERVGVSVLPATVCGVYRNDLLYICVKTTDSSSGGQVHSARLLFLFSILPEIYMLHCK